MQDQFTQLKEQIKQASKIFLITHPDHDLDAIGSLVAMTAFLKNQNKTFTAFIHETPTPDCYFFPHLSELTSDSIALDQAYSNHDLLIILDCPNEKRAGLPDINTTKRPNIAILDHHITTTNQANLQITTPQASSTCELVTKFLQHTNFPFDKKTSTALLCGLMADTGIFYNASTTPRAVTCASELINQGGDYQLLIKKIFHKKKLEHLKFLGLLLSKINYNAKLDFAHLVITKHDLETFNLDHKALVGVPNFLQQNLKNIDKILILKEKEDGNLKGTFRSSKTNIQPLAVALGGGGHPRSCGFSISGHLQKTKDNKWQVT